MPQSMQEPSSTPAIEGLVSLLICLIPHQLPDLSRDLSQLRTVPLGSLVDIAVGDGLRIMSKQFADFGLAIAQLLGRARHAVPHLMEVEADPGMRPQPLGHHTLFLYVAGFRAPRWK